MDSLPETPGSVVTFDLPPDSDGSIYRACVTLIVGHIDGDTVQEAVWASGELSAPDDASCVFEPAQILASRPTLAVQTSASAGAEPESLHETGTVIRVVEHGIPTTYTYAPSYVWKDELQEHFWTNAYGDYWVFDEEADVTVLYAPVQSSGRA